jgi:uncharacterized ubiquitin-like protein YukD
MSEPTLIPFFHWREYKDESTAIPLEIVIINAEPYDLTFSTNIDAYVNGKRFIIPLWNFDSVNQSLLNEYIKLLKKNKIKNGTKMIWKSWLGISRNNRPIRRWRLELL